MITSHELSYLLIGIIIGVLFLLFLESMSR